MQHACFFYLNLLSHFKGAWVINRIAQPYTNELADTFKKSVFRQLFFPRRNYYKVSAFSGKIFFLFLKTDVWVEREYVCISSRRDFWWNRSSKLNTTEHLCQQDLEWEIGSALAVTVFTYYLVPS